jgi:hypothetical protein
MSDDILYGKTVYPSRPTLEGKGESEEGKMVYDKSFQPPQSSLDSSKEAGARFFKDVSSQKAMGEPDDGQGKKAGMIYDKTPVTVDDGERMSEEEVKPAEILYDQSPQFYEKDCPVTIPKFGSGKGEVDKVFLRDTATFAIGKIQESFDNGTKHEVLDHWVKICEESPVVDRNIMPRIRELAEMGKAVTTPQELETFINALKNFRTLVRIK